LNDLFFALEAAHGADTLPGDIHAGIGPELAPGPELEDKIAGINALQRRTLRLKAK
jgi:hypothetical protein